MFSQLALLLQKCLNVTLMLAANKDGTITVTVVPKAKGEEGGLSTPLSLTGTPAELDGEFVELLAKYVNSHKSLAEQLEATTAILEASKAEATNKATKAISAKPAKSDDKKPAPLADDESLDEGDGDDDVNDTSDESQEASTVVSEAKAPVTATTDNLWG